jgi:hypothetical protein
MYDAKNVCMCLMALVIVVLLIVILIKVNKSSKKANNVKFSDGPSGSISKECQDCINWQNSSGIDYRWVPCESGGCSPCGTDSGYRTPQECLSNPSQFPAVDCSQACYPPCDTCSASGCTDPSCVRVSD